MSYVFLGVFAALPYLILFVLGAAVLCVFGVKLRTALVASGAVSLALNLGLCLSLGLNAVDYSAAALGKGLTILPYLLAVGLLTLIPNAKILLEAVEDGRTVRARTMVISAMLATALVASGAMWYNRHPVFIIPEECAAYVDRDILRDSLCSRRFGKMTLYIRVVGATGTSLCAEAVYFPFFDSLGCAREYNADTGRWIGEYYEP